MIVYSVKLVVINYKGISHKTIRSTAYEFWDVPSKVYLSLYRNCRKNMNIAKVLKGYFCTCINKKEYMSVKKKLFKPEISCGS